jgi:N6-adenosine-specific RNA methylase IME4
MRGLLRFVPSEIDTMARSLLAKEQEAARERMAAGGKGGLKLVKVSRPSLTLDAIGRRFDISGRQLRKIMDVCEAAAADPDRFGPLLAEMDAKGKVDGPHTKLLRMRDEIRILDLAPVEGRFRTLVLDPPWQEDNISEAAGHDYATMPFEEILAVPVQDWSEENCHLYLWATNNTLITRAPQLLTAWGFAAKTVVTWRKRDLGLGRYMRNTTEHVIFAVRGELKTRAAGRSTRTDYDWPVGDNSAKPEGFYDLVRACSYPPYGEAFQRLARPDFTNLYAVPPSMSEAAE